jgi:hypothetical protein
LLVDQGDAAAGAGLIAAEPDWAEQPPADIEQDASPVVARVT